MINNMSAQMDKGNYDFDISDYGQDIHTVGSLLKKYFKELPDPGDQAEHSEGAGVPAAHCSLSHSQFPHETSHQGGDSQCRKQGLQQKKECLCLHGRLYCPFLADVPEKCGSGLCTYFDA